MRILVTGVSGLRRNRAWTDIDNTSMFDLGSAMLDLAEDRHMDLNEGKILHASQDTLTALRAAAVARINLSAADKPVDGIVIISTHSVFARLDGLVEGLLPSDIKEINPDRWITLIDGPQAIEDELRTHMAEYFHLDLCDITKWQELEVFFSHHLATEHQIECTRNELEPKWRETMVSGCKGPSLYGRNLETCVRCSNVLPRQEDPHGRARCGDQYSGS